MPRAAEEIAKETAETSHTFLSSRLNEAVVVPSQLLLGVLINPRSGFFLVLQERPRPLQGYPSVDVHARQTLAEGFLNRQGAEEKVLGESVRIHRQSGESVSSQSKRQTSVANPSVFILFHPKRSFCKH